MRVAAFAVTAMLVGAIGRDARADTYGFPVPRGTRQLEGDRYNSGRGLRDTVEFFRKELDRRGVGHRRIGPYRVRGVDVTRFVIDAGDVVAVHVYRVGGKTLISFVKRARS